MLIKEKRQRGEKKMTKKGIDRGKFIVALYKAVISRLEEGNRQILDTRIMYVVLIDDKF